MISFWILTSDLRDLRDRLVNRGWIDEDNNPRDGVQMVRLAPAVITPATYDEDGTELAPAVMDTLHRVYVRVYSKVADDERDDGDVSLPMALRTRLGRMVRENGTWDDERKGWVLAGKFWLIREDQREPDHMWQ